MKKKRSIGGKMENKGREDLGTTTIYGWKWKERVKQRKEEKQGGKKKEAIKEGREKEGVKKRKKVKEARKGKKEGGRKSPAGSTLHLPSQGVFPHLSHTARPVHTPSLAYRPVAAVENGARS